MTKGYSNVRITEYIEISITDKIGGVFMYVCVFARPMVGFQVFGLTCSNN